MNYSRLNKLSYVFKKKASAESFSDAFNKYEKVTDSIDDIKHGLASWYVESIGAFDRDSESKEKFSELADKAHEIFSGALESIKSQLEPIENEMDKIFEDYFTKI